MKFKLVCFDLDGVLTEKDDSWSYIHHYLGVWELAKANRQLFFTGKIDYQQWANADVGLWKNTPFEKLNAIIQQIRLRPNIDMVVEELKHHNLKLLILSSGLSLFADSVKNRFNFDFAIANTPVVGEDGKLTGEVNVKVSYDDKDLVLKKFLTPYKIKLTECIAVGDGDNDISLFKAVGYSIALNPMSEAVANAADIVVRNGGLVEVLSIILTKLK
jgi:phosphoserine phosphatase